MGVGVRLACRSLQNSGDPPESGVGPSCLAGSKMGGEGAQDVLWELGPIVWGQLS